MVDAVLGNHVPPSRNSANHRVAAGVMREFCVGDDEILAKYSYLPEPLAEATVRRPAA